MSMPFAAAPKKNSHDAAGDRSDAMAVRTHELCLTIDERRILQHISLDLTVGQSIAILGHNGAGKSTLLGVLATLLAPTSGKLTIFDQPANRATPAIRARIGMIGHQPMLYRELSALENLVFFGKLYGVTDPKARAATLLERVGLASRRFDPPKAFSRGMVQRLSIARAMMHDPDLLLADEPFSGLDVASIRTMEKLLGELHAAGKTVILTHHDIAQSLRLTGRVVVLRKGQVVMDQPTDQVGADAVTAEVIGQ